MAVPNIIICGDSRNGTFLPRIQGLKGDIYELTIYNRMGQQVFHTEDPVEAWQPVSEPQGAYAYVLRLRFEDLTIHTYTGVITLVK